MSYCPAAVSRIEIHSGWCAAKKKPGVKCGRGGGGSSGRTMDQRSRDDPWVMRVLAFLIADDAAKEHAARPHRTLPRSYSLRGIP